MSAAVVRASSGSGPFFTTAVYYPGLVSCASLVDEDGRPLESIRDRGTCLDAANAVFGGSTLPSTTDFQVWVEHNYACSGCFARRPR